MYTLWEESSGFTGVLACQHPQPSSVPWCKSLVMSTGLNRHDKAGFGFDHISRLSCRAQHSKPAEDADKSRWTSSNTALIKGVSRCTIIVTISAFQGASCTEISCQDTLMLVRWISPVNPQSPFDFSSFHGHISATGCNVSVSTKLCQTILHSLWVHSRAKSPQCGLSVISCRSQNQVYLTPVSG